MTYIAMARDVNTVSARLGLLARSVAAGAFGLLVLAATGSAQTATTPTPVTAQAEITAPAAIRPFRVNVADEVDKGGHFDAWEQPELFAAELRAAFRPLRQAP